MDNVIEFPAKEIRSLVRMEKSIRSGLRKGGASTEVEEELTAEMLELLKKYSTGISVTSPVTLPETLTEDEKKVCLQAIEKTGDDVLKASQNVMAKMLGDLVDLQVQLYVAKGE